MPLRCLVFSSNEEMVQPIWQVLTDLGIEGEYCASAVDAVERVTTQLFQIVITDWEDQPEAAFLLKTARDLKAAYRPLTLAIVSDDARLPEALQAGANSVLVKPIRPEQVRDTMGTACELLRSRQAPAAAPQPAIAEFPEAPGTAAMAAAAGASFSTAPAPVTPPCEKAFRAGEFLQSQSATPGGQFDTECEVQKSLDQSAAAEVEALTELEPKASAVAAVPAAEAAIPQTPLTGWASLQERLTKAAPVKAAEPASSELLSYGETTPYSPPQVALESKKPEPPQSEAEASHEAALFAYMDGEPKAEEEAEQPPRSRGNKILLIGMLAACVVLLAIPQTRLGLRIGYRKATVAGKSWLNPQPAPVPQAPAQHDSFGQEGDEFKLPVAANIPDATTDASQIRVLPVLDPTAKPPKGGDATAVPAASEDAASDPGQNGLTTSGPAQIVESPAKEQTSAGITTAEAGAGTGTPGGITATDQVQPVRHPDQTGPRREPLPSPPPAQIAARTNPPASTAAIPSSLRSQIASMTPEASGAKPPEAAMSSIEPVSLPEAAAWSLLAQPVDAVYPDSAKASGQRGSVVLQVLIGRDGAVQDAKFLQGSLVFARAAIEAVKQWRFKPYALNGRAVSVQTVITLNLKPPA